MWQWGPIMDQIKPLDYFFVAEIYLDTFFSSRYLLFCGALKKLTPESLGIQMAI